MAKKTNGRKCGSPGNYCLEEDCMFWNRTAKDCNFNVGADAFVSFLGALAGKKQSGKKWWEKLADYGLKMAEGVIEKAMEEGEKGEEDR